MKFIILREQLLKGLQFVIGVVEKRQSLPILSNVLLSVRKNRLAITGTDLEIELTSRVDMLSSSADGEITVSGRKLIDICRTFPEDTEISIQVEEAKLVLLAGRSRFTLATLPANDFPLTSADYLGHSIQINQKAMLNLFESTFFAMAQQDVRYYLNGLFVELAEGYIRTVATDGHRLALRSFNFPYQEAQLQFILPRKGVIELIKHLKEGDAELQINIGSNAIKIETEAFTFISRLIDGRFPDYNRVLPKGGDKVVYIERDLLKSVLQRVAILSNEKYRAVRMCLQQGLISFTANNTEQEQAQDDIVVEYQGPTLEIGFNVNYFMDILNVLPNGDIKLTLSTPESSALIESDNLPLALYVVMPMCL